MTIVVNDTPTTGVLVGVVEKTAGDGMRLVMGQGGNLVPGCRGGKYTRDNIRPACGRCNSETGGALAVRGQR